jgi:hypothetical protein
LLQTLSHIFSAPKNPIHYKKIEILICHIEISIFPHKNFKSFITMSYNNNNNNRKFNNTSGSQRPVVYKSFCKVCQDAGKPESLYTNHNVRQSQDKNSPVTCPTLLAQECRNCFKKGHSSKYCPQQQQGQPQADTRPFQRPSERYQQQPERPFQRPSERYQQKQVATATATKPSYQQPQPSRQAPKNVFMVFEEDEEDQAKKEEQEIKELQQSKLVPTPVAVRNQPAPLSYAKIITVAPEVNKKEEIKFAVKLAEKEATKIKPTIVLREVSRPVSWHNCESDSEGDEEEEEQEDNSAW